MRENGDVTDRGFGKRKSDTSSDEFAGPFLFNLLNQVMQSCTESFKFSPPEILLYLSILAASFETNRRLPTPPIGCTFFHITWG